MSHKETVAQVFGRAAPLYDQIGPGYFVHFGRRLVDLAGIAPGQTVLDVAPGRGAVLLAAADAVGPAGSVTGIDIAPPMVAELERTIRERTISHATVRVGDAEKLPFADAAFDAVLCGFGIFFFPDQPRALAEFRRVLRPGGRLAVSIWGDPGPVGKTFQDICKARGINPRQLTSSPVQGPDALRQVLSAAGFSDVRCQTTERLFRFANEHEWWEYNWSHGGRAALESLDPAALEALKTESLTTIGQLMEPDGLPYPRQAHFGLARKPLAGEEPLISGGPVV